jgi:predicted enzyme related to lactoylglutathione lyase
VLFTPDDQKDRVGTFSNIVFTCDDIQRTYEELRAKGVEFTEAPTQEFWGWWAVFKDPDGNTYGLGQGGE